MTEDVTVLLVDDVPENLIALEAVLEPLGYRTLTATSGELALRHLLNEDVALILLDVRMPGMDGFETAQAIKMRERTRDIPIVFLTAFGDDTSIVAKGISSGAVDYLTKPVDPDLLRAKTQVLVDLHQRATALKHERESLAQRLDAQYAAESRNLRKLADAALVINSTQTLAEMLRIINDSAREVTSAHESETILVDEEGAAGPTSRSAGEKYATTAGGGIGPDFSPLRELVWRSGAPVRMTAKEVEATFASYGVVDVASGHPMLEGWLAAPLYGRTGRRLGIIQVADKVDGDFTDADEVLLLQLAQLASVAIENAERFEQEHSVAEALQRGLLPTSLPSVPGVRVAARYRPGGGGASVGGDWYDVVCLPDGRLALTIGDVMGRGPRAAAIMGQVRTALHAYALHGLPASVSMRSADLLLQDVAEGAMATAVYLVLDPSLHRLDVVSAGHPPPLLVGPDGVASFLACDPHTPLGVVPAPVYTSSSEVLVSGSLLLLYTDGLVEDRETGLEQGLAQLASTVDPSIDDLGELCDAVIAAMVPAERDDDVCVLAVRVD